MRRLANSRSHFQLRNLAPAPSFAAGRASRNLCNHFAASNRRPGAGRDDARNRSLGSRDHEGAGVPGRPRWAVPPRDRRRPGKRARPPGCIAAGCDFNGRHRNEPRRMPRLRCGAPGRSDLRSAGDFPRSIRRGRGRSPHLPRGHPRFCRAHLFDPLVRDPFARGQGLLPRRRRRLRYGSAREPRRPPDPAPRARKDGVVRGLLRHGTHRFQLLVRTRSAAGQCPSRL